VEAVQDVDGPLGTAGDHVQVGLPHVAAHELKPGTPLRPEPAEETHQRLELPVLVDPQQAAPAFVDLVDQRHGAVSLAKRDLIDADGPYVRQVPAGQTPLHSRLHGPKHRI